MGSRTLVLAALVLVVGISGCTALLDSADISVETEYAEHALEDEEYRVVVEVTNNGSEAGNETVSLTVDDETVERTTVTVAPEGTETIVLEHTFEDEGHHDVSVGEDEWSIEVTDNHNEIVEAAMDDVSSFETAEYISGELGLGNETISIEGNGTGLYDVEAEQAYLEFDMVGTLSFMEVQMASEEWYEDGTLYEREEVEGETDYWYEPAEFEDVGIAAADTEWDMIQYIAPEKTEEAFVYSFDLADLEELAGIPGMGDLPEDNQTESVESFGGTVTIDRVTHRIDSIAVEFEYIEETPEGKERFAVAYDATYLEYNINPDISVPDEVREQAEPVENGDDEFGV